MSGTLSLAASIAAMDRQALEGLVAHRRIVSPASVNEPLGLALELLRPDSISRALQSAHREALDALLALSEVGVEDQAILYALASVGLVGVAGESREGAGANRSDEAATTSRSVASSSLGADAAGGSHSTAFIALPEVTALLPRDVFADVAPLADPGAAPDDLTGWFAAGLTSVRRAAKILHTIAAHPVRLGRKGRPAVIAVRDLAVAAHCSPEQAARLLDTMRSAGLLSAHTDYLGAEQLGVTGAKAQQWLMQLGYAERWFELARAAISRFDARLRSGIAEADGNLRVLAARLPHEYPLLPASELEALLENIEAAEDLGLALHGWVTPVTQALLHGDEDTARELATHEMPSDVAGVYVQPDLSIIVPGPLPPADEAMLHAISETEQLGPAASLRVSTDRLTRAVIRAGSGTGEVRAALERLSLTGIPQPLDYLLRDIDRKTAEQAEPEDDFTAHDVLIAAESGWGAAAASTAAGPSAARSAAADFAAAGPVAAEITAAAIATEGSAAAGSAAAESAAAAVPDESQAMIDRILSSAREAGDEGDLTRRLELAIRDRSAVRVTAVAGKDEREFTLLPVSLKGGRLRATDQQAGVERTLPVSAITAVAAVAA